MNELFKMKLHETLELGTEDNILIVRVPGGWIYTTYAGDSLGAWRASSVFVPYSKEFQYKPE